MTQTRALVVAVYVLAAAVLVAVAVYAFSNFGPDSSCAPEARQAALSQDASDVVAGRISMTEAANRQAARNERCGD